MSIQLQGTLLQPNSPFECTLTPGAVVKIGDDGRIVEAGTGKKASGTAYGDEGCWILPGFIDAHLHVPQWDRRGIDGLSLGEWQKRIAYPAEARFEDADVAAHVTERLVDGLIECGTTTLVGYGSPFPEATNRSFEVFARRGMRVIFGMMLNDSNCPDELHHSAERGLEQSRSIAGDWRGAENGRINYAFCLRSPACCSEKLMRGAVALAEMFDCYIQTNVGESQADVEEVRERFPEQVDDVDLFSELGLLTPRTLLAHGVILGHEERARVSKAQTTLIHCPTANLFMQSGLMDYAAHRAAGVPIALGSSIASGYEPFMVKVAVTCLQTAKALKVHAIPRAAYKSPTPAEAWWMLTAGAARALKLDDRIGNIKPGLEADCLVVRPEPWINELPADQRISALLYTLRPDQIEHVFIAGKLIEKGS